MCVWGGLLQLSFSREELRPPDQDQFSAETRLSLQQTAELKHFGFLSGCSEPRTGMLLLVGVVVATVVVRMNGARVLSGELDSSI